MLGADFAQDMCFRILRDDLRESRMLTINAQIYCSWILICDLTCTKRPNIIGNNLCVVHNYINHNLLSWGTLRARVCSHSPIQHIPCLIQNRRRNLTLHLLSLTRDGLICELQALIERIQARLPISGNSVGSHNVLETQHNRITSPGSSHGCVCNLFLPFAGELHRVAIIRLPISQSIRLTPVLHWSAHAGVGRVYSDWQRTLPAVNALRATCSSAASALCGDA